MTTINFTRETQRQLTEFNGIQIFIDRVSDALPEQFYIYCKGSRNIYTRCGIIVYNNKMITASYISTKFMTNTRDVYKNEIRVSDDKSFDECVADDLKLAIQIIVSKFQMEDMEIAFY